MKGPYDLDRMARDIRILKWMMLVLLFLVFLLGASMHRAATRTTSSGAVGAPSTNEDGQRH